MQRGPGAEVVPSEIGGQTEDARLAFSPGGSRLQHRVVDADVFALQVELAKSVRELARAISRGNLFEERSGVGKVLAQRVRKRVGAPEKHAAVPEIVARVEKLSGRGEIRLLGETAHAEKALVIGRASLVWPRLHIAVTSFRASRADTEDNKVFSRRGDFDSWTESGAVLDGGGDYVIGGKHTELRIGIVKEQKKG